MRLLFTTFLIFLIFSFPSEAATYQGKRFFSPNNGSWKNWCPALNTSFSVNVDNQPVIIADIYVHGSWFRDGLPLDLSTLTNITCDVDIPDDPDGDGIPNNSDSDDDGDDIPDVNDLDHPSYDPNHPDSDRDGDGISNRNDQYPDDPENGGNGGGGDGEDNEGCNADADSDGDGVEDCIDVCPLDRFDNCACPVIPDPDLPVLSRLLSLFPSSPDAVRIPTLINNAMGQGSLSANLMVELYNGAWQFLALLLTWKVIKSIL